MRGKPIALLLAAVAAAVAVYMFWPLALDEYVDAAEQIVVVRTDDGLSGEAGSPRPWVVSEDHTLERGTPEFEAVAALLSGESCHRTLRYPDGTGGRSVTLWFYGGCEHLGGYLLMDSGFVRDMDNRDYTMGLFTGEPVRELTDAIAAALQWEEISEVSLAGRL